ncbi:macrophage migration inhibitory factor-like [Diadema antillarum]|uniref:macrophage migration inhibitory factor-like n=1 Tax=Diadema antillarum TaxID=105358 RepID=UPI003A8AA865
MPLLQVFTNVRDSKIPDGFLSDMSDMFQKAIGKPMEYIEVHVVPNQMLMFAKSDAPCAVVNLVSIGQLGVEENKVISQTVSTTLKDKLGIPADRMYVIFRDIAPQDVGFNNTTFAS